MGVLRTKLDHGIAISRMHALNSPTISRDQIFCLTDENILVNYPIQFIAREDLFMGNQFNVIIRRLLEAGFITKWSKEFRTHNSMKKKADAHRNALNLEHLSAAWIIILVGLPFCCLVFASEHVAFNRIRNGNVPQNLIVMEHIIFQAERSFFNKL